MNDRTLVHDDAEIPTPVGSLETVALYGNVMKNWYKDNPPTQAKINALLVVIKGWRERYEDTVGLLEKWHFAETLMRDEDFMYCKDIRTKLEIMIADSKKDPKFRGQTKFETTVLHDNQMGNPVKLERI